MIEQWRAADVGFLTFLDEGYPTQLREIHEVPPVLFHRGRLLPHDPAVSVVGSRAASARGLQIACTLAADPVSRGISLIASLAKGIDTAAHTTALDAGGRTIAVTGTGTTQYYPTENRGLQQPVILPEMVVHANAWARALINRPGVHVADSARTAMALAEELVSQHDQVDQLVAEVLAARG